MSGETRGKPRFPFMASVEVIELESQASLSARTSDLSSGGCYVDTMNPFPPGTKVKVRLTHESSSVEASGHVAYSQPNMGMGVTFTSIRPDHQAVLDVWLAHLKESRL